MAASRGVSIGVVAASVAVFVQTPVAAPLALRAIGSTPAHVTVAPIVPPVVTIPPTIAVAPVTVPATIAVAIPVAVLVVTARLALVLSFRLAPSTIVVPAIVDQRCGRHSNVQV